MPNKPGTGDLYTSNNEFNANVTLTVGNTTVNTSANSTMLRLANSTVSSNLGIGALQVGANVVVNVTSMLVGNSTVNTIVGNTSIAVGNTTANLQANSIMVRVANSVGNTAIQPGLIALTEGGVINWDVGDITLTQTADDLRLEGGGLVVGHTARFSTFSASTITPYIQTHGISQSPASTGQALWSADTTPPRVHLAKSRGTTIGSYTIVADGDNLGEIRFEGADGTDFARGAAIRALVDGAPGTGDMPGEIVFLTSGDGSETPGDKMRVKSDGGVIIGSTDSASPGAGCLDLQGGQIIFPATKNASVDPNTLDDYEEGTWTPAMTFNNSSTGVTYSTQNGTYTLVGRMMQVYGFISLTSNGTGVGTARITGFPIASGIGHIMPGAGKCSSGGSAATGIFPYMGNGAATATLCIPQATATTDATDTNCTDTFNITFQMNYYLD